MLENWQTFLIEQGATIDDNVVSSFNTPEEEIEYSNNSTILCDLSHYTLIKVTGADANRFLQGQLSNDINNVNETQSQMSSYCTPKGRALALFRVFQFDDAYCLSLPTEIAEKTINRLKMFIMRSDVTMEDVTDDYFHFGIAGEHASANLNTDLNIETLPTIPDEAVNTSDFSLQKLAGSPDRFEIFGHFDTAVTIWKKLSTNCQPVGQSAWNLQRINAGIPEILTETTDGFVPQMLNLQLINAVNFQKGCYPGQEIVARTKYLGKLKKRLYLAEITTENTITIGTDLYESGDNQQSVGKVVSAEPSSTSTYRLLLVLRISASENQPIFLSNKSGPTLTLLDLPYNSED